QGDTLTSVHGYYFENSRDAYFRKNVVVNTESATIYTDSMRYNSASKMTYFYGPTNIQGTNGNLYTENGDYNTQTKFARFGKNNLYTEGSKFLRGDSLLYDGQTGNGRAIKNVIFVDTAQHLVMHGQLGTYNKSTEKTIMTDRAYIVLATEETERDTVDSLERTRASTEDTVSSEAEIVLSDQSRSDSIYMTADTLMSQVIPLGSYIFANLNMDRSGGPIDMDQDSGVLAGFEDFNFDPDSLAEVAAQPDVPQDTNSTPIRDTVPSLELDSVREMPRFEYDIADS